MKGHNVGYIRVSSADQNADRQLSALTLDRVFEDKATGASLDRPQLQECLAYLRQGDTLHVHSIDRLARNLLDLQQLISRLGQKGASVHFHKESLIFKAEDQDPMAKLLLHVMGAFAEFERSLIRERQREGIAAARRNGKRLGRGRALTDAQVKELKQREGEGASALARAFCVGRQTVYDALAGVGAYAEKNR